MSTKMTKLALAIGAMVMVGGAMAADATGTASATVINPITVSEARALAFGSVTASVTTAGTVALTAVDEAVKTDTTVSSTGTQQSGKFTVLGGDSNSYTITVPATASLASTSSNDAADMTVTLTQSKTSGSLVAGTDAFFVGGSLAVAANQNSGAYTGTYTVTVAYQ